MKNSMRHGKLKEGRTYENAGGGFYKCTKVIDEDTYEVVNVRSGWTCVVHTITVDEFACIEWDYSNMGYWDKNFQTENI